MDPSSAQRALLLTIAIARRMDCTLTDVSDWDAAHYHQVSDPQTSWGIRVLDRLQPVTGERILDIGCGTGRLTAALQERAPDAVITAIDASRTMVEQARRTLRTAIPVLQADGAHLPFVPAFDAVFSTATFHWIPDHPRLFAEIHRVLTPGGRLVSQAGGGANLARLYGRAAALASDPEFSERFDSWMDPWNFADVSVTEDRLRRAGFEEFDVWLESTPTSFADARAYRAFVTTVCLRHHLDRLDASARERYLDRIVDGAADDDPPFTLDYWRLNIDARKR
jgi:trans-aconitate 2-methyltransferase